MLRLYFPLLLLKLLSCALLGIVCLAHALGLLQIGEAFLKLLGLLFLGFIVLKATHIVLLCLLFLSFQFGQLLFVCLAEGDGGLAPWSCAGLPATSALLLITPEFFLLLCIRALLLFERLHLLLQLILVILLILVFQLSFNFLG